MSKQVKSIEFKAFNSLLICLADRYRLHDEALEILRQTSYPLTMVEAIQIAKLRREAH